MPANAGRGGLDSLTIESCGQVRRRHSTHDNVALFARRQELGKRRAAITKQRVPQKTLLGHRARFAHGKQDVPEVHIAWQQP